MNTLGIDRLMASVSARINGLLPDAGVLDPLVSQAGRVPYLDAVRGLDEQSRAAIRRWLTGSLDAAWQQLAQMAPSVARIPRTPFV